MFVAFRAQEKKGSPIEFDFYVHDKCPPSKKPDPNTTPLPKWETYTSLKDGVPPPSEFDLPKELWLVTRNGEAIGKVYGI